MRAIVGRTGPGYLNRPRSRRERGREGRGWSEREKPPHFCILCTESRAGWLAHQPRSLAYVGEQGVGRSGAARAQGEPTTASLQRGKDSMRCDCPTNSAACQIPRLPVLTLSKCRTHVKQKILLSLPLLHLPPSPTFYHVFEDNNSDSCALHFDKSRAYVCQDAGSWLLGRNNQDVEKQHGLA